MNEPGDFEIGDRVLRHTWPLPGSGVHVGSIYTVTGFSDSSNSVYLREVPGPFMRENFKKVNEKSVKKTGFGRFIKEHGL